VALAGGSQAAGASAADAAITTGRVRSAEIQPEQVCTCWICIPLPSWGGKSYIPTRLQQQVELSCLQHPATLADQQELSISYVYVHFAQENGIRPANEAAAAVLPSQGAGASQGNGDSTAWCPHLPTIVEDIDDKSGKLLPFVFIEVIVVRNSLALGLVAARLCA
jgi:hypothetical protein